MRPVLVSFPVIHPSVVCPHSSLRNEATELRRTGRQVFTLTVKAIKERNADAPPDDLAELIEEAVERARAHSS